MTEFIAEIREIGVPDHLIEKIYQRFKGCQIYIPMMHKKLSKKQRDAEIAAKHNGHNYKELMAEYDVSLQTVYVAVNNARSCTSKLNNGVT